MLAKTPPSCTKVYKRCSICTQHVTLKQCRLFCYFHLHAKIPKEKIDSNFPKINQYSNAVGGDLLFRTKEKCCQNRKETQSVVIDITRMFRPYCPLHYSRSYSSTPFINL